MFDWNSLEWVSTVHTVLRWTVAGFLVLLVVATALEVAVGNIKDKLLGEQISELEKRQGPRALTDTQKAGLVRALSQYRGQRGGIYSRQGDPEATQFGYDFEEVFREAGWKVGRGWMPPYSVNPPPGISIVLKDPTEPFPAAEALKAALEELGYEVKIIQMGSGPNYIALWIGQK